MKSNFAPILEGSIRRAKVDGVLENWAQFNKLIGELNLHEMYAAYCLESVQLQRKAFLNRLVQRMRVTLADQLEAFLEDRKKKLTSKK